MINFASVLTEIPQKCLRSVGSGIGHELKLLGPGWMTESSETESFRAEHYNICVVIKAVEDWTVEPPVGVHCNTSPCCLFLVPAAGMQALFQVSFCGNQTDSGTAVKGQVRQYFIAAEKVLWNYAPSGMDIPHNILLTESGR